MGKCNLLILLFLVRMEKKYVGYCHRVVRGCDKPAIQKLSNLKTYSIFVGKDLQKAPANVSVFASHLIEVSVPASHRRAANADVPVSVIENTLANFTDELLSWRRMIGEFSHASWVAQKAIAHKLITENS
jgi:hypothetical protein